MIIVADSSPLISLAILSKLRSLQKSKNIKMPQKHQVTKFHKIICASQIPLVSRNLSGL